VNMDCDQSAGSVNDIGHSCMDLSKVTLK
jgi:hypothetical protein